MNNIEEYSYDDIMTDFNQYYQKNKEKIQQSNYNDFLNLQNFYNELNNELINIYDKNGVAKNIYKNKNIFCKHYKNPDDNHKNKELPYFNSKNCKSENNDLNKYYNENYLKENIKKLSNQYFGNSINLNYLQNINSNKYNNINIDSINELLNAKLDKICDADEVKVGDTCVKLNDDNFPSICDVPKDECTYYEDFNKNKKYIPKKCENRNLKNCAKDGKCSVTSDNNCKTNCSSLDKNNCDINDCFLDSERKICVFKKCENRILDTCENTSSDLENNDVCTKNTNNCTFDCTKIKDKIQCNSDDNPSHCIFDDENNKCNFRCTDDNILENYEKCCTGDNISNKCTEEIKKKYNDCNERKEEECVTSDEKCKVSMLDGISKCMPAKCEDINLQNYSNSEQICNLNSTTSTDCIVGDEKCTEIFKNCEKNDGDEIKCKLNDKCFWNDDNGKCIYNKCSDRIDTNHCTINNTCSIIDDEYINKCFGKTKSGEINYDDQLCDTENRIYTKYSITKGEHLNNIDKDKIEIIKKFSPKMHNIEETITDKNKIKEIYDNIKSEELLSENIYTLYTKNAKCANNNKSNSVVENNNNIPKIILEPFTQIFTKENLTQQSNQIESESNQIESEYINKLDEKNITDNFCNPLKFKGECNKYPDNCIYINDENDENGRCENKICKYRHKDYCSSGSDDICKYGEYVYDKNFTLTSVNGAYNDQYCNNKFETENDALKLKIQKNGKMDEDGAYCALRENINKPSGVDIHWNEGKNIKGIVIQGRGPYHNNSSRSYQYAKNFKILKIDIDNNKIPINIKAADDTTNIVTLNRKPYELDKKMPIIFDEPLNLKKDEKIRILATGDSKSYNAWKSFRVGAILDQNCSDGSDGSEISEKYVYKKIFDTCAIVDTKENDKHIYLKPENEKSKEMCEKICNDNTDCKGYQVSRSKDGSKIGACHIFVSNDDYDIANLRPTRCVNNSTTHKTEFYLKEKQLDGLNICSYRDSLNCSNNCQEINSICVNTNKCQFRTSEKECNIGGNCIYDKENGLCHTKCEHRKIESCFNNEDPSSNKCLPTYDNKCKKLENKDCISDHPGRVIKFTPPDNDKATYKLITQITGSESNVEKCKNYCMNEKQSYDIMALQNGVACFCGNASDIKQKKEGLNGHSSGLPYPKIIQKSNCKFPDAGGPWAQNIHFLKK